MYSCDYTLLLQEAAALLQEDNHPLSHAANLSALLYHTLPALNWAGFYFLHGGALLVGPFQGKPACLRIPIGKGVCGSAVQQGRILRVPDVHAFPGHIACDEASASEIVLPLRTPQGILGVLDIDSPIPNRFTPKDEQGLEKIAALYVASCDFSKAHYTLT